MFTGIIESVATVKTIEREDSNVHFTFSSEIANQLTIDQSVSHNGVCLTVVAQVGETYTVTAIKETLEKSNLGKLLVGHRVNLERCMLANGRFDGHIVQGHVDQVGECKKVVNQDGSWLFTFEFDPSLGNLVVEKGSICINGVSLTCFDTNENSFSVAIIPYTFENTNFNKLIEGEFVNLEFDVIGKYVKTILHRNQ